MIVIVSWVIGEYLSLFFRSILAGPMIAIASWAIENNLACLRSILVYDCNSFLGY